MALNESPSEPLPKLRSSGKYKYEYPEVPGNKRVCRQPSNEKIARIQGRHQLILTPFPMLLLPTCLIPVLVPCSSRSSKVARNPTSITTTPCISDSHDFSLSYILDLEHRCSWLITDTLWASLFPQDSSACGLPGLASSRHNLPHFS